MLIELYRVFKKPSAASLAQAELEEAQRQLLIAESGLDYAVSIVQYNRTRVARLARHIRTGAYDAGTAAVLPLASVPTGRADIAPDAATGSPSR